MAQGMLLRESSPATSASTFNIHPHSSIEEKLMLFHLFDRHDRFNSSNIQESSSTSNQISNTNQGKFYYTFLSA